MGFFTSKQASAARQQARGLGIQATARKRFQKQLRIEQLEDRRLLAGEVFNDPDYSTLQWGLNNVGQNGGTYDIDIDASAAWSISTGSMNTILAEVDSGIDYTNKDVYLNIWINQAEIPASLRQNLIDTDSDGRITFRDLNIPVNFSFLNDANGNGYRDGGDLLLDVRWTDGIDGDANGRTDDLIGWDFQDNDNDPKPEQNDAHGTTMSQWIGGIPNNNLGSVGVNWSISIMPVRTLPATSRDLNPLIGAAGLDYAVANQASISVLYGGNYIFSQTLYDAVDRARLAGHLVVAPAGNDSVNSDITPRYPASFNLDNMIAATSINPNDGMDAAWNYGLTTVDLAGPTSPGGGTSGGAAYVGGVAALLKTIHPEWNYQQLKDRILSTVEPSAALAGKTVTGGRLNAASALAETSIHVSDPSITETNSGTSQVVFTVTRLGDIVGTTNVDWTTTSGTAIAGNDFVFASGQLSFATSVNSLTISIAIIGDQIAESTETFLLDLSNATGNTLIADSRSQATIIDNDTPPTKFYVVNDGSPDRTYEYSATGSAIENYSINSGNTQPRGAASNVTGNTVWVADKNRKVYVYNTSGGLQGSWSAGSLASNALVEGVATNGTDVWIVDSKSDKVFRYSNAAGKLTGSQNAASSFSLNGSNTNPKGIVTDGTYLWVVNDSTTDKVFKYQISTNALVSSWTIIGGGGRPTGITLDPSNASMDMWIVDSSSDKVYRLADARTTIATSVAATSPFSLVCTYSTSKCPFGI